MGFRLSLASIRAAISDFFGGKTVTRAASPPPVLASMALPRVPEQVPAAAPAALLEPTTEATEALHMPEREDAPCAEGKPAEPAALVAAPDPDAERLLARCGLLQAQMLDLTNRLADMEQQVRSYEQHQYLALGEVVGECLRLRNEYLSLRAALTRAAADREEARQAAEDFDAYRSSTAQTAAPPPELDDDERDELRRLYRAAVMLCHPDRAEEAERAEAHDMFLRVQAAYQACDLTALRGLGAELSGWVREAGEEDPAEKVAAPAGGALRRRVAELQTSVADLILAVQTLQLDPAYRQAVQVERWEADFAEARARFEAECEALREQIAALSSQRA